jgi:homoserine acetyltransferase
VRDFETESGTILPEARFVSTTLGRLNAAGTNVILGNSRAPRSGHAAEDQMTEIGMAMRSFVSERKCSKI